MSKKQMITMGVILGVMVVVELLINNVYANVTISCIAAALVSSATRRA